MWVIYAIILASIKNLMKNKQVKKKFFSFLFIIVIIFFNWKRILYCLHNDIIIWLYGFLLLLLL